MEADSGLYCSNDGWCQRLFCLQPVSGVGSAESGPLRCDTDVKQEFIMNE